MGAPRVSPAEIVEMQRLYRELGTYAAVARKMKRSPETVARYVKNAWCSPQYPYRG